MPFIPSTGTAKVAITWSLFGQTLINTLWFQSISGDPWNNSDLDTLAFQAWAWAEGSLTAILSNDISLTLVEAVDQSFAGSAYGSYTTSPANGDIVSQSLPTGSCLTIKFATGLTGRSNRGRNYISGLPEVRVADNAMDSTFTTSLVAAYEDIPASTWVNDAYHVVCSHFADGAPRETAVVNAVTGYIVVDANIDSQRRRLTGRGS